MKETLSFEIFNNTAVISRGFFKCRENKYITQYRKITKNSEQVRKLKETVAPPQQLKQTG